MRVSQKVCNAAASGASAEAAVRAGYNPHRKLCSGEGVRFLIPSTPGKFSGKIELYDTIYVCRKVGKSNTILCLRDQNQNICSGFSLVRRDRASKKVMENDPHPTNHCACGLGPTLTGRVHSMSRASSACAPRHPAPKNCTAKCPKNAKN